MAVTLKILDLSMLVKNTYHSASYVFGHFSFLINNMMPWLTQGDQHVIILWCLAFIFLQKTKSTVVEQIDKHFSYPLHISIFKNTMHQY